jgi:hypothetical protein
VTLEPILKDFFLFFWLKPHFICNLYIYIQQIGVRMKSSYVTNLEMSWVFHSCCCCISSELLHPYCTLLRTLFALVPVLSKSKLLYDWRLASMSWYGAPLLDLRPNITSCRNVTVWNLRSCFCGAHSLTRGQFAICSVITQWSESLRIRNHTLLSHLRLPQPGGPGFRIYIPQEQGSAVIPSSTVFPLCRRYQNCL